MSLLEHLTAARESGDPARLAQGMPYAQWMNIAPENTTGELLTRMRFDPKIVGNTFLPAIHGGTIGALLETAAIFHMLWHSDSVNLPKIVNITVDYLRSARALDTLAKATVTKQGRRMVNVFVEAWQDDRARPVATANAHFLVQPPEGESLPVSL